jgi:Flp pilus assembly protein TadG
MIALIRRLFHDEVSPVRRAVADDSGVIAVMAAIMIAVFVALVGASIDYGILLIQKANIQNAVDAAVLAGSRQLVSGTTPGEAAAAAAADTYMGYYGYLRSDASNTFAPYTYQIASDSAIENEMRISVTHTLPTYFLKLIGVNSFTVGASAQAEATPGMTDIGLSLDLTGSMELTGTSDLAHLQSAVQEFVNDINPDTTNPIGPQIAMAQWAGIKCGWSRNTDPHTNETNINLGPNTWLGNGTSEYVGPCSDDKTVLTKLTKNKTNLLNLASGTQAVSCPSGMSNCYALQSWYYNAQDVNGSGRFPSGMTYNGSSAGVTCFDGTSKTPCYTGTKLPNGISVMYDPANGVNLWSTANGGRNTGGTYGNAHKVLVMMTDGNDELWPSAGMPSGVSTSAWDTDVVNRAAALKLGPDGIANTDDDVEIYVVGFYCTPQGSNQWCTSALADTTAPHPCPGTSWPPASKTPSAIDTLLRNVSSSSPGTCDHYFPMKKTENLSDKFKTIAGAIARGKLIQ